MDFDKGFENIVYNCDCIELMRSMQRGGVVADFCITDIPYGVNYATGAHKKSGTQHGQARAPRREYADTGEWDKERITKEYFDLMFAVSKEQIIFGGNYYTDYFPPTKSWIVWDKRCNDNIRNDFPDCELAYCSTGVARVFHYYYNGMLQGDMKHKDGRWHSTQKPTQLFTALINYYTKPNDLILDPFMGSFTTAISCHRTGRRFVGAEISKDYFDKGYKRYNDEVAQISIFDKGE